MSQQSHETFSISGDKLVNKVKELIKEGNAQRIMIKNEEGETVLEIPLTVGAVGVLAAPLFAAVGAFAALVKDCSIEVVRKG